MQFNNRQFESGVKESLGTLDKLKKGLNLDGAAKGLNNLSDAGKNFSLAGIASGVDQIAGKFSALGILGVTAMVNIANAAVNAGMKIVKSLTIDPITTGFSEYETKMGAIQTILTNTASKGTTLEDVNTVLNDLNEYSDQTIYNFAQMAKNIGTFTAAGIGLETSAEAIKGIANLAAGSGSTSEQASNAMYQLSQALAAGKVGLMDWNSVVNSGMGGELFKKALEGTAEELGRGRDMSVSFRESLESGWINAEVLTKTLQKFAKDKSLIKAATEVKTFSQLMSTMQESVQSGWAQTWEAIVGDKDQSTKMLTGISNAFGELVTPMADARNAAFKFWNENGGRDDIITAISEAFKEFKRVITPIIGAWEEIFPPMTGQLLVDLSKKFLAFVKSIKLGSEEHSHLITTFAGVFSALNILRKFLKTVGGAFGVLIKKMAPVASKILEITSEIGFFLIKLDSTIERNDSFTKAFENMGDVLSNVADLFTRGLDKIQGAAPKVAETLKSARDKIKGVFDGFEKIDLSGVDAFISNVKEKFKPFEAITDAIGKVIEFGRTLVEKAKPVFGKIKEVLSDAVGGINLTSLLQLFNSGVFAAILLNIVKLVKSFREVADKGTSFLDKITSILDGVKDSLKAWQNDLKAGTLLKIAGAVAILAGSLFLISMIDPAKMQASITAITILFGELLGSMAIFDKIAGSTGFKSMGKVTFAMLGLSVSLLILSKAVKTLGEMDWQGLTVGMSGLTGIVALLIGASKMLAKSSGDMIKASVGLILFGIGVRVIVSSVKALSELDPMALVKGLAGLAVVMGAIMLFMKDKSLDASSLKMGAGLILVAVAIRLIVNSVAVLGSLDPGQLAMGLAALGALILGITSFTKLVANGQELITAGIGLMFISAAMIGFALAVKILGSMNPSELGQGLIGFAGALMIVTLALSFMPPNMPAIGLSLLALAGSMILLAIAIQMMGSMPAEQLVQGLFGIAAALTILVIAINAMTAGLAGAAALAIVTASLFGLAIVMRMIGAMGLPALGIALLGIAGVLAVLGGAALLLTPVIPSMLALGAAMLLLGIGIAAVGAGSIVLGLGLAALSAVGIDSVGILLAFAAAMLPIAILSPAIVVVGAALLVLSVGVFALGLSLSVLGAGLNMLAMIGPQGVMNLQMLAMTAVSISKFAVEILAAGAGLLLFGAGAILAGIGAIIAGAGLIVFAAGMKSLAEVDISNMTEIGKITTGLIKAGAKMLIAAPGLIAGGAGLIAFGDGAVRTGEGLKSIEAGITGFVDKIKKVPGEVKTAGNSIIAAVKMLMDNINKQVSDAKAKVISNVQLMCTLAVSAINMQRIAFYMAGTNVVDGFIQGIRDRTEAAAQAAAAMAARALKAANHQLAINSPSKAFAETGKFADMGLAQGLTKYAYLAVNAAKSMAQSTLTPVMEFSTANAYAAGSSFGSRTSQVSTIATDLQNGSPSQRMINSLSDLASRPNESPAMDLNGLLTIQVTNDKGEIIGIAQKAIKDLLRKESR